MTDDRQQEEIDALNTRIDQFKESKCDNDRFDTGMFELKNLIANLGKGGAPIEFKMPESNGISVTQIMIDKWNQAVDNTVKLVDITDKHETQIKKSEAYVSEIQRKLGDFALKEDLQKTQHDVNALQGLWPLYEQHEKDIAWLKDELSKLKK